VHGNLSRQGQWLRSSKEFKPPLTVAIRKSRVSTREKFKLITHQRNLVGSTLIIEELYKEHRPQALIVDDHRCFSDRLNVRTFQSSRGVHKIDRQDG